MERVPQLVRRGKKDRRMGAPSELDWEAIEALRTEMRVELIQELIPLGLAEVGRVLDEEVERLAGPRHARKGEGEVIYRHGSNPGSVRLGGQRHPIRVPRVRGLEGEARLESYERLHWAAGEVDEGLFRKVLLGISCRDYEAAVEAVPGAIGLSKSTVSREFKKATARQLKAFQERELTELDVVALFLDGKTFANDEIVVALAVTMGGDKVFAGFVQTETENARVITSFLRSLKDRGLDLSAGALVVIDGAKGLKSAVTTVFRGQVLIQRCQWHKRENVVSYLPRTEQKAWRVRLQRAYERPTYEEAKRDLKAMRAELDELNQSAVASLDEGFEETLTLHRLGVFPLVGRSLKTTNVLESVNAQAEQRCGRVDRWRNSNHKQRWLAAALIDIEPRLGYSAIATSRRSVPRFRKNSGSSIPIARLMPQPERPEVTRVSTSFGIDSLSQRPSVNPVNSGSSPNSSPGSSTTPVRVRAYELSRLMSAIRAKTRPVRTKSPGPSEGPSTCTSRATGADTCTRPQGEPPAYLGPETKPVSCGDGPWKRPRFFLGQGDEPRGRLLFFPWLCPACGSTSSSRSKTSAGSARIAYSCPSTDRENSAS